MRRRQVSIASGSVLIALVMAGSPAVFAAQPAVSGQAPEPDTAPIISREELDKAVPEIPVSDDSELDKPLESIEVFEQRLAAERSPPTAAPAAVATGPAPAGDPEIDRPLVPLEAFQVRPSTFAEAEPDTGSVEVAYRVDVNGLGSTGRASDVNLMDRFEKASALRRGKGRAANAAQVASRAGEDVALVRKLLASEGWFDARVTSRIDRGGEDDKRPLAVVIDVVPGKRFVFEAVKVDAAPTIPPDLIRDTLSLRIGAPVVTEEVLAAEAKVALALPQHGYPFAELGERDVLLDPDTGGADYTLPVSVGPRGSFGGITSEGKEAFGAKHVAVLSRFKRGELYDSRQVDDLRLALIATGLFRAVSVEPRRTGQPGPDGTEAVDLLVRQEAGPPRVIAATAGYGTGEGFRVEGSWTHRNLFRPEGALILSGLAGTLEQGVSATFRRSNAGKRDRTFELAADFRHSNYDAFSAYTGKLSARISRDSTPLWQKRVTYAYGGYLIGTNESGYDRLRAERTRRTYAIAGLSGQVGLDTTDSLLDPAKGFRLTALVEPEGSLHGKFSPYARLRLDGSTYFRLSEGLIIAGRARLATIQGAALDELAPSRRIYAGGGGSVRGFGYQKLGPQDPNGDPAGGRSLNEAALELRYRFGDYGIAAFADVGQAYASSLPKFSDLRAGVGVGARIYTNFGPMRVDVATPLGRRKSESRINVYVSIGQAF